MKQPLSDRLKDRGFSHPGSPHHEDRRPLLNVISNQVDELLSADEQISRIGIERRVCGGMSLILHHLYRTTGSIYNLLQFGLLRSCHGRIYGSPLFSHANVCAHLMSGQITTIVVEPGMLRGESKFRSASRRD